MKYFITIRLLDMATTIYGIKAGQFELNPFNNRLLSYGIVWFILVQLLFIYVVSLFYKYRLPRLAIKIFTIINTLVVLVNVVLILLVVFYK